MRPLLGLLLSMFAFAACSTAERRPAVTEPADEPVLIATGGPFEIHVRDGRVLRLVPSASGQPAMIKEVHTLDELRTLYETARGEPMPAARPGGGVALNGWAGLECVRKGNACGTAPEYVPSALVVIHFE